jgi:hypothetical protein
MPVFASVYDERFNDGSTLQKLSSQQRQEFPELPAK